MNIGIDIDDTIINTSEMLIAYAQKYDIEVLGGTGILKDDKAYFFNNTMFDWTEEEYDIFMCKYIDYIFENATAKPLVKEIFEKLKKDGHKIIIITARDKEVYRCENANETSKKLFDKNNIKYDKLLVACHNKVLDCKENKIDVFIDDRLDTCKNVSDSGILTFVMNATHNNHLDTKNMKRVYSWEEIYYLISKLKN
jgi:uncharacterized HAD superfamily protein